jgi:hypothetical protein
MLMRGDQEMALLRRGHRTEIAIFAIVASFLTFVKRTFTSGVDVITGTDTAAGPRFGDPRSRFNLGTTGDHILSFTAEHQRRQVLDDGRNWRGETLGGDVWRVSTATVSFDVDGLRLQLNNDRTAGFLLLTILEEELTIGFLTVLQE